MAGNGSMMVLVGACLMLASVCQPLAFVGGGLGVTSSVLQQPRDAAAQEALRFESEASMDNLTESSWTPCLSFLAAVALGVCFGVAAPQACYARGQALQDLGARSVPGSMTWVERLRIEQASMPKATNEAAVTEQKIREAAVSDPKEKRVADAMELMRAIAKEELHPSKELPAYNQSFM
eukprot:TRINITY_DN6472_c0_g3_i1.p2 TRINITY_DN6472_c0_g3~~TRINITY_DN6472_c0_g3_i1.p2  ORF type:complete len:179 (+),score=62.54 TRINITY_DN6472_c0_g3_i1:68-604(+)